MTTTGKPSANPKGLEGTLRTHALTFPEATEDFPWGHRAIKVRGKAFVFMGTEGGSLSFSVKLPRTGFQALALPFAEPTGYGLGRSGWVTVRPPANDRDVTDQCLAWIGESYRAVAPKKLLASLDDPASPSHVTPATAATRKRATQKQATAKAATRKPARAKQPKSKPREKQR
jgi:predicted DNA-binding protein (MmcQ/YjbR family)